MIVAFGVETPHRNTLVVMGPQNVEVEVTADYILQLTFLCSSAPFRIWSLWDQYR